MKPPIAVGVAIIVAFGLLLLVGPKITSNTARDQARQALEQAQNAAAALAHYDPNLPVLRDLADLARMKGEDAEKLVDDARARLEDVNRKFTQEFAKLKSAYSKAGFAEPNVTIPSANGPSIRNSAKAFDELLKSNDEWLKRAATDAAEAATKGDATPGAPDVRGIVEYVRAATLLSDATAIREKQEMLEQRLALTVAEWTRLRAYADHYAGLEVSQILAGFRRNLDEMTQQETQVQAQVDELSGQVDTLKKDLASVNEQAASARARLLEVQNRGFEAGNDAAFNSYRIQFEDVSAKMRELERREQELRFGSLKGAKIEGDDPAVDPIQGGEQAIGLETRERQLAIAQDKLQRIKTGREGLEAQMKLVQESGLTAKRAKDDFDADMNALKTQAQQIFKQLGDLSTQAVAKEGEAIKAAQDSARYFAAAQTAVNTFMSAAQERQAKDQKRENVRLRQILEDPYARQGPESAEAAARVLAGRIFALRAAASDSLGATISDLDKSTVMKGEVNPELTTTISGISSTARSEGLDTLDKARAIYERLAADQRTARTSWVPKAALAGVHHLMALLDASTADTHLSKALSLLNEALKGQEKSPYLREHADFRDHLQGAQAGGEGAGAASQPAETGGEEKPAGG